MFREVLPRVDPRLVLDQGDVHYVTEPYAGEVLPRVDPRLVLDQGDVHYVTEPYAGVEYGLRLGSSGALLFMPEGDLAAPDWQDRLRARLEAAKRYLEGFPRRD